VDVEFSLSAKIEPNVGARLPVRRVKGFTLIELLVVIAIIAILAALLFPVFFRAKSSAGTASCTTRMKQLGIAVILYADAHEDRLMPFAADLELSRVDSGTPAGTTISNRWWHQILPYTRSRDIFRCPADPIGTTWAKESGQPGTKPFPRSYMLNRALESLSLSVISSPGAALVIEKYEKAPDAWFDPPRDLYTVAFLGFSPLDKPRHAGGIIYTQIDTSTRFRPLDAWRADPCGLPMSGIDVVREHPIPDVAARTIWHPKCPR